jgi:TaqI-like C-terminal specificity domain/N-6 DNA Methylase/Eco57I restriction-modification methylase
VPVTTIEEGLTQVRELVARFRRNLSHYRSAEFDETSTREQFINPLFEALGWDVLDHAGHGADRDVIFHSRLISGSEVAGLEAWDDDLTAEELAAREPYVRIPDYAFRYDSQVQFFVEAKKPSTTIRRKGSAFQVKSYAWNQRVPFAVLTDFDELRVFNCSNRPDYDSPDAGLLEGFSLSFEQYESAWPRLWEILSYPSVARGALDRLRAPSTPRGAIPVDEAFLRDLDEWRARLAQDLYTHNPDLTAWQLAEATQRILDRLVFLRVCEDRGIETELSLRRFARITDSYHALIPHFRDLDVIYNGALFAEHFSEHLEVGDGIFQRLIASLYFPSPYKFDAIGADLLGSIYERFLGKEVQITSHQVKIVPKPEVRHGGGVYYTPRWVVDRVVSATLDPLLADRQTPRAVANLRILDPACGSGSFLLGALDYLIAWHERYYTEHPKEAPDNHYQDLSGRERLTTDAKAQIVTNCLYGVDIDPQAVEVAQMSIYLKLLEEETRATLTHQPRLFHRALLPDLRHNIRSGNSLLDTSHISGQLLYDEAMRRRINPFDWQDNVYGFGRIFAESGGFHAIIGNPPYTRVQVLRRDRPEECEAYSAQYASGAVGSFDIASLFVERGLSLLRQGRSHDRGGRLGFIISRQFVETDAGRPLRRCLAEGRHVSQIVDFGTGLVFAPVAAYTLLLHLTRRPSAEFTLTRVPPPPSLSALRESEQPGSVFTAQLPATTLGEEPWSLSLPEESSLLDRLGDEHASLQDVSGDSIFQGVVTGADSIFRAFDLGPDPEHSGRRLVRPVADETGIALSWEQDWLRPIYAGKSDFRRFHVWASEEWLILPYRRSSPSAPYQLASPFVMAREAPQIFAWLAQHREQLEERSGEWTDMNWFSYSRRQNLEKFAEPKILVPYILDELCAVYDTTGHYFVNVTTGGYGVEVAREDVDPIYLSALLNSRLLSWVLRRYSRAFRGGWFAARKGNLAQLPIAVPPRVVQEEIVDSYQHCVRLVAELYGSERKLRDDDDSRLLHRLAAAAVEAFDRAVFELYGLSAVEIALVREIRLEVVEAEDSPTDVSFDG